jgi:membrane-associated phospholipid phosphatase
VPAGWYHAFTCINFKLKLFAGIFLLGVMLSLFPAFFRYIEQRNQLIAISDPFLANWGPVDLSLSIFIIIWGTTLFFLYRCLTKPVMFVQAIYALLVLCIIRMGCIYLVPLEPPADLIALRDPLSSLTYGGANVFITKDLFFSGHTSNMLILVICLQNKWDKIFAGVAAVAIGIMVLLQHVHYSIDVLAAFAVAFLVVPPIKQWVSRGSTIK